MIRWQIARKAEARNPAPAGHQAHGRDREGQAELQPRPFEHGGGRGQEAPRPRPPGRSAAGGRSPSARARGPEAGRCRAEAGAAPPQRKLSEAEQIAQRRMELRADDSARPRKTGCRQSQEARRREDREQREMSEDERRRAEENRKAEEEAARQGRRSAGRGRASDSAAAADAPSPPIESEERAARPRPTGGHAPAPKRPEPARPSRGRDEHRQRGKLTVSRALSGEDDSRARSLAALKRVARKGKAATTWNRARAQSRPATSSCPKRSPSRNSPTAWANAAPTWSKPCSRWACRSPSPRPSTRTRPSCWSTEFGHVVNRVSDSDIDIDTAADVDRRETAFSRARRW